MTIFKSRVSETPEYDPRYNHAQSVGGAKARYTDPQLEYGVADLETDLDRLLSATNRVYE